MKIKLFGDALVVTSSLKKEDLHNAERFCKDSLTLRKKIGDEKAQPVFAIGLGECGGFNKNGIIFDSTTEDGYVCTTVCGGPSDMTQAEKAQSFTENYATALAYAIELETQIEAALAERSELINNVSTVVEIVG